MRNIIQGIRYINSKGYMHRDIKPQNILLVNGKTKTDIQFIDFGLGKKINKKDPRYQKCGTPGFVAPEQFGSSKSLVEYDEKCDVYSAGIILYILLSGQFPFRSRKYAQLVRQNKLGQIDFELVTFK